MNKEKLRNLILKWIGQNYGSQEMEEPCYDINSLSEYLEKECKYVYRVL